MYRIEGQSVPDPRVIRRIIEGSVWPCALVVPGLLAGLERRHLSFYLLTGLANHPNELIVTSNEGAKPCLLLVSRLSTVSFAISPLISRLKPPMLDASGSERGSLYFSFRSFFEFV